MELIVETKIHVSLSLVINALLRKYRAAKINQFLSLTEIIDILCGKQAARDCSFGFQNIKKTCMMMARVSICSEIKLLCTSLH